MSGQRPSPHKIAPQKINAVMNGALLRTAIRYILKGGLRLKQGHLPQSGHKIPVDFAGVGVTAAEDPAADEFILEQLAELGISQVRIDFSYGDENGPVARLLTRLLQTDIKVMLHLVQPFEEAFAMKQEAAQQRWRQFLIQVCEQFGQSVDAIEVCSTINRRRWAGYDTEGFFTTWRIAHQEIKSRQIKLAGPNISDFEPLYTISVLKRMRRENLLPDIHTNNLFCERVTEPERFDHRILGIGLARKLKVNLVKKARLLKKIASEQGVTDLVSPSAFWTLPRIQRLLVNSEEKQADYLSRYMVLLAASGAMRQTYWGPLLCWREGLIDDGSGKYPDLERITHYQSVLGKTEDFRPRPAFAAMKQFIKLIPGSRYEGPLKTAENIEVHAFRSETQLIHVMWTINGKALRIADLYQDEALLRAETMNRDGKDFEEQPQFISETPMYLCWPADAQITLKPARAPYRLESIYAHRSQGRNYAFEQNGWSGLLIAENAGQAQQIIQHLHPDNLPVPTEQNILRKARNVIWTVTDPDGQNVIAKKPLKMHPHKRLLDRFKPCKARRSWIAAAELSRRGIATAAPIAYFEKQHDSSLMHNVFVCEKVDHDFSAREMIMAFRDGHNEFEGIAAESAYRQLSIFLQRMHEHGVFFRDLAGGNILIKKLGGDSLQFTLIDINRARFYNHSTPLKQRISDLTRICNKLHWQGREFLVEHYLHGMLKKRHFTFRYRLPFYLYDFKVNFKRRFGRKAIKRGYRAFNDKSPAFKLGTAVGIGLLLGLSID